MTSFVLKLSLVLGLEKEEFMRIMRDEVNVDRDVEVKMISLADKLPPNHSNIHSL